MKLPLEALPPGDPSGGVVYLRKNVLSPEEASRRADHLRTKIIIDDETLDQVSQFTYLGCSISYQFSAHVESKLAKFLQLMGTIKRNIF